MYMLQEFSVLPTSDWSTIPRDKGRSNICLQERGVFLPRGNGWYSILSVGSVPRETGENYSPL